MGTFLTGIHKGRFERCVDPGTLFTFDDLVWEHFSLVSIRVGLKGDRIYDSLVIDELVTFVLGEGVELISFRVSHDLVRFDDLGLAGFEEGLLDFVQDILTHDVVVELGFSLTVEAEPSDLTFDVTILGLVSVVLGTP